MLKKATQASWHAAAFQTWWLTTADVWLSFGAVNSHTHRVQVSAHGLANWKGERAGDFSASKTKAPLTITAKYISWETSEKADVAKLLLESKSNVTAWFVFTVGQPQDRDLNTKGKAGSSARCKLDFTHQQPRERWVPSAEHTHVWNCSTLHC